MGESLDGSLASKLVALTSHPITTLILEKVRGSLTVERKLLESPTYILNLIVENTDDLGQPVLNHAAELRKARAWLKNETNDHFHVHQ
jgi:hypothetical protein